MMPSERRWFGTCKAWESTVPLLNYHVPLKLGCCRCWREGIQRDFIWDMLWKDVFNGVSKKVTLTINSVRVTIGWVAATVRSNWCFVVDRVLKRERLDDRLDGTFLGSSPFFVISDIKNFTSYFHVNGYLCVDLLKYIPWNHCGARRRASSMLGSGASWRDWA